MRNIKIILFLATAIVLSMFTSCENKEENVQESSFNYYEGCKYSKSGVSIDSITSKQTCIQYFMDGNTLIFKHINAGFNCTPDNVFAEIRISNNLIIIEESQELTTPSDCKCLFDIEMQITNVEKDAYTIKIFEPYQLNQMIEFNIDLSANTTGTYCVDRTDYPWGEN